MYLARSLARNTTGPAISSGAARAVLANYRMLLESRERARDVPPSRPNAVLLIMPSRFAVSARSSLLMSVAIVPGRTAFARMLYLPSATAQLCIRDNMPAFVGV